jgi:protein-tyrosine phosphatase
VTSGIVDVHCHVLPGVDDGAPDVEAALDFLRAAQAGGTRAIVATPHQHPGRYPNAAATLRAAHALLLAARDATGEELPEVLLGAEVHLDHDLPERVEAEELLTLAGGPYLLLELPDQFAWPHVEDTIWRLRLSGRVPVIAHPERCGPVLREPARLRRLVELGCLVQVTGSSVAGVFGGPCRAQTEAFLRQGLVHVVASDAHDLRRRTPDLAAARQAVTTLLGGEAAARLFEEHPRALMEGRPLRVPPPSGPPTPRPGLLERLGLRRRA